MSSGAGNNWEQKLKEAGARVEEELRTFGCYLDEEVLPDVKRHSSTALRAASEKLAALAQHIDDSKKG